MPLSVKLAGIDRTANVRLESLQVVNTIAVNSDAADLRISLQPGSTWRPMAGNELIIANGSTATANLVFAGMILEVTEKAAPATRFDYDCSARDYLHLFDKILVASYTTSLTGSSANTVDGIAAAVVRLSTDGFSTGGIVAGPTTPNEQYDYRIPGDILRKLADEAGYAWWIDYAKTVYFVPTLQNVAPVASLNIDTDITDFGSMDISESVAQIKDYVIVKGWKQKSTTTYANSYRGDGNTKFFQGGYEASSVGDITATLNGSALTVETDGVDGSAGDGTGSSGVLFACFDNLGFRFGNFTPSTGDVLSVSFPYMKPGITFVQDLDAQSTMAAREGGSGVHQYAYDGPHLTATDGSISLADAKANAILRRDAWPRLTGKFISYTAGWRAGQYFTLVTTKRMPPTGINKTVYVQEVVKKLVNHPSGGSPTIRYEIKFADSFLPQ